MDALSEMIRITMERSGKDAVINSLAKMIRDAQREDNILYTSCFFEKVKVYNDEQVVIGYKLVKRTEDYVSRSYDLSDCNDDGPGEFLYDDNGVLYPVTVGSMSRQDMEEHEIVYGSADMVANGKVVGTVIYTDH